MIIRNPINPYPQNITIDPESTSISFTFSGDRLGSYQVNVYSYPEEEEVGTTGTINIEDYKYNNENIAISKSLMGMNVQSYGSYTWEVIMSPYEDLGVNYNNDNFTSLRYFFEANSTPQIVAEPTGDNSSFMVNGETKEYTASAFLPRVDLELNTRNLNIEGYYSNGDIKYYYFELFDEDENLIEKTEKTFSGKIVYKFSGFLSPKKYTLHFVAVSQKDQYTNVFFDISVRYSKTNISSPPVLICNEDEANVTIKWAKDNTSAGKATGDYDVSGEKVKINSGTIVYNNISSLPIVMNKNNFTFGIKTKINDETTKIFDYVNNDILYEVYMENYEICLKYGEIGSTNKIFETIGNFKTNIVFGIQDYSEPQQDTGYMMYIGGEEYQFTNSDEEYILISNSESYEYEIILQNDNGTISWNVNRIN